MSLLHFFRTPLLCVMLTVVLLSACKDAGTDPKGGGEFVATLVSPNPAESAAVIELSGSGIAEVSARGGQVFTEQAGSTTRVVVILDTPGRIQFGVRVAPGNNVPAGTVLEVADSNDQLRTSLSGYSVEIGR
jgi:hypothetical protein